MASLGWSEGQNDDNSQWLRRGHQHSTSTFNSNIPPKASLLSPFSPHTPSPLPPPTLHISSLNLLSTSERRRASCSRIWVTPHRTAHQTTRRARRPRTRRGMSISLICTTTAGGKVTCNDVPRYINPSSPPPHHVPNLLSILIHQILHVSSFDAFRVITRESGSISQVRLIILRDRCIDDR